MTSPDDNTHGSNSALTRGHQLRQSYRQSQGWESSLFSNKFSIILVDPQLLQNLHVLQLSGIEKLCPLIRSKDGSIPHYFCLHSIFLAPSAADHSPGVGQKCLQAEETAVSRCHLFRHFAHESNILDTTKQWIVARHAMQTEFERGRSHVQRFVVSLTNRPIH